MREVFAGIVFIIIASVAVFSLSNYLDSSNTRTCKERFGSEWESRGGGYSARFCVNSDDEVKYP